MNKRTLLFTFLLAVFIAPFSACAEDVPATPVKNENYQVLEQQQKDEATQPGKVHIIEFFNYGCPACFQTDPYLEKWLQANAEKDTKTERQYIETQAY